MDQVGLFEHVHGLFSSTYGDWIRKVDHLTWNAFQRARNLSTSSGLLSISDVPADAQDVDVEVEALGLVDDGDVNDDAPDLMGNASELAVTDGCGAI